LPHVVDFACGLKPTRKQREKVVPKARGRVLEVGFGSGLNLPFYDARQVRHVWALEPSQDMWTLAKSRIKDSRVSVEHVAACAEAIPLETACADTVLMTYTLCTVPDPEAALSEIRRVLRPGGELVFCEHGAAPDVSVRKWQDRLNPIWKRLGGGCNLNRNIPRLLEGVGFEIRALDRMYIPGWKPASFNYWGTAR
jgi:ubiquinone/menaquinone biosynthesis C-methylase UbiE